MARLTYLTFDSLAEGVGSSQVTAYVERLPAYGFEVDLYSFEKGPATAAVEQRLRAAGVRWHPQVFGSGGSRGGSTRVLRGAWLVRRSPLVHARSDLAAASAMLGSARRWVWDVRSFWADQRIELGALVAGSPEERALRFIERRAARGADAIVTLTDAAIPVLAARHGPAAAAKVTVITTCVDLHRFAPSPLPSTTPVQLLLSGTLNRYYDVPAMVRFAQALEARRPAVLRVLAPGRSPWDEMLRRSGIEVGSADPSDMSDHVRAAHAGLSICRLDAGVSLRAAAPTKVGEFLASGRPVVVNHGLGDMPALVTEWDCGIVVRGTDDASLDAAAEGLVRLLDDPETPARCRRLAEEHFDLDRAVERLARIYRTVGS